ncbi:hypothetical protein M422DRAFT_151719 [Sphaerobolus stellatus SS14]|nr:hypothetical protein M422DRAFT_151719 [Sphaerobolus stellatus SS14]
MAVSFIGRILRRLKATSAHIGAFLLFSGLLSYIFIFYQPSKGPGESQQLGWQSWDNVSPSRRPAIQKPAEDGVKTDVPTENSDNSTEWWDVEGDKVSGVDSASLPLHYWDPLLPHDTGCKFLKRPTDLFSFPPWMVDLCWPKSTPEDTANKGKWVRVERNLNGKAGTWYVNMYYRRTRKLDIPLITDLRLLPEGGDNLLPERDSWYSVGRSVRDGVKGTNPLFLWFKLGPTYRGLDKNQTRNLITELDVIYGSGGPMYGFQMLFPEVVKENAQIDPATIAYRRGPPEISRAPPLHFNHNGTYKILQVADLHFSVSHGKCRDTDLTSCNEADDLTSSLLAKTLDIEKPDLVVFTGDQLNGQKTSWDSRSVLAKFAIPVIDRKIPWTAVFGNHDDETDMNRAIEMKHLMQLPYFVGSAGPKDVHGVGNFVLKVRSPDPSMTHLLTIYLLDSGAYDTGVFDLFGFIPTSYDYLRESQIDWFLNESAKIQPIERPFTPDGTKDLGHIFKKQGIVSSDGKRLAKPNALMFFHMPMQEAYSPADVDPVSFKELDVGQQLEGPGSAKKNAGFFEKALLGAAETDDGRGREVKVVGNGHCHISENCRRVKGIWMCFGGGGSYAGYGKIGFDRRFRVYNVSEFGETIQTYKRTEHGEIVDQMVLAGEGAPTPYQGS